jgi:methylated-DNA-protein-cysteine methyltransferase-like protein
MKDSAKSQSPQIRADRARSRAWGLTGTSAQHDDDFGLREEIWQWVAAIPPGRVATYGQIARLAGFPRHARYVGATLKQLPKDTTLPWFRVLRSSGELAFAPGSASYCTQRRLLQAEAVVFRGGKVSLREFGWNSVFT